MRRSTLRRWRRRRSPAERSVETTPIGTDEPTPAARDEPAPEWEYVPEGWARARSDERIRGWDVVAIALAYEAKWPSFMRALAGNGPLGVDHEVPLGHEVAGESIYAHNMVMSWGYVLARAAAGRDRLSVLDWGGGIGHYYAIARALLPEVAIEYHIRDVPALCEHGRSILPEVAFHEADDCLDRRYDVVLASGSLQYSERWGETLAGLAGATGVLLCLTRVPVVLAHDSYVVVQRPYEYGYETEYLGWIFNRGELLREAERCGLRAERELIVLPPFDRIAGAPEPPLHRGWLFRPQREGASD